jgi:hypothetical protein
MKLQSPIARTRKDNAFGSIGFGKQREDTFLLPYSVRPRNFSQISISNPKQLFFIAVHDPIAYRITFKSCEDAINPWFTIVDFDNRVHEKNKKVQEKLQAKNAKEKIRTVATWNEIFGRSWLTRSNPKNKEQERWHAISPLNLSDWKADVFDDKGELQPLSVIYEFQHFRGSQPKPEEVSPEDYLFHRSRPRGLSSLGISILEVCYDDLHYLYNIRRDMAERIRKYAGFPHAQIEGATTTLLQAYKNEYGDLNKLDELWSNEKLNLEMKGLEGTALNPDVYYKPFIEQIAIATGIPSPILRGTESGQLKSGQINLSSYYSVVSNIQAGITELIEQMIEWVSPGLMKKARIRWNMEFAYSDVDRAALNQIKVENAVSLQPYISDEAFARLLQDLGIKEEDIEEKEQLNPFGQPFGNQQPNKEGEMNPISEEAGREFGKTKNPKVRSET